MREIWTDEDELGFQIGDMNGEWESKAGGKAKTRLDKPLKPEQRRKSVPVIRRPIAEIQKRHIRRIGK